MQNGAVGVYHATGMSEFEGDRTPDNSCFCIRRFIVSGYELGRILCLRCKEASVIDFEFRRSVGCTGCPRPEMQEHRCLEQRRIVYNYSPPAGFVLLRGSTLHGETKPARRTRNTIALRCPVKMLGRES